MKHCQTAFDNIFPELINCDKPEDRLPKHLREPGKDLAGVSEATHAKRSCGDKVGGCWSQALRVLTIYQSLPSNYIIIKFLKFKLFFHPKDIFSF